MLRSLAVIAGCLIVAATAHVVIMSSGGYGTPTGPLQIAVALGLCTGSVCIGSALGDAVGFCPSGSSSRWFPAKPMRSSQRQR